MEQGPRKRGSDEEAEYQGFTSPRHAQRFLSAFSRIATGWRHEMADRFTVWNQFTRVRTTTA
jgi:hypothetical protein